MRYKKIVFGEMELEEINGIRYLIYPTLKTRVKVLEIFKNAQRKIEVGNKTITGDFDLDSMIETCTEMVFEGCFEHDEKGNRKSMKQEFVNDGVTELDIKANIIESGVFELYLKIAAAVGILSDKKKDEITQQMVKETKN
jgi:hypothetical protein